MGRKGVCENYLGQGQNRVTHPLSFKGRGHFLWQCEQPDMLLNSATCVMAVLPVDRAEEGLGINKCKFSCPNKEEAHTARLAAGTEGTQ